MASAAGAMAGKTVNRLSDSQRAELEKNRTLIKRQKAELIGLRRELSRLTKSIESSAQADDQPSNEVVLYQSSHGKHHKEEQAIRIKDLENQITKQMEEAEKRLSLAKAEGHIASELATLGAECRGFRHEQVIDRQRDAIIELRGRIKGLEENRPPAPNHDRSLQQMFMLKRELVDMRAAQNRDEATRMTSAAAICSPQDETLQREIDKARHVDRRGYEEAAMERSAHRETKRSLEASEETYLSLMRAIAKALGLEDVAGSRHMTHLPEDERDKLVAERKQGQVLLVGRIGVLKERITCKDDLLQGYETDLVKLRQAEKLSGHMSSQIEHLVEDIRFKSEESQYLRESLHKTRHHLEQEKRLNSAVKSKKTFHLEQENVASKRWPRHQCPPEDVRGQEKAKKRNLYEKLKRKNYEITTLRNELSARNNCRSASQSWVVPLENAMLDVESWQDDSVNS